MGWANCSALPLIYKLEDKMSGRKKDIPVKNVTVEIHNEIYLIDMVWIVGDYDYYQKVAKRKYKVKMNTTQKSFGGECLLVNEENGSDPFIVVWLPEISFTTNNYDSIVHELSHAAFHILNIVGIKIGSKNQEPFAYLLGWLVRVTLDRFHNLYRKLNRIA